MDTPGANIPFPRANAGLVSRQVRCVSYGISFSNDGHTQEGRRNAGDGQARARVLAVEQRLQVGLELFCAAGPLPPLRRRSWLARNRSGIRQGSQTVSRDS